MLLPDLITFFNASITRFPINVIDFSSLRPVVLEPYEPNDDVDGYPEKNLPKKSADYYKAREVCTIFELMITQFCRSFHIKNGLSSFTLFVSISRRCIIKYLPKNICYLMLG